MTKDTPKPQEKQPEKQPWQFLQQQYAEINKHFGFPTQKDKIKGAAV